MSTEVLDPESRRQRMKEIQEEMAKLEFDEIAENNAVECDEKYEELLELEPVSLIKGFQEALEFTNQLIRDLSNNQLTQILDYFNGKSPTQKKKQLLTFLKEFGCYRTKDFRKLRNRLFGLRNKGRDALKNGTDEAGFYQYCKELGFKFD